MSIPKSGPAEGFAARSVDSELARAVDESLDGLPVTRSVSAPILMPSEDKLTIRLVPVDILERLREADGDRSLFDALLWAMVGGIVGVVTAILVAGTAPTAGAWILGGAFLVLVAAFAVVRARFSRRVRRIRAEYYANPTKNSHE